MSKVVSSPINCAMPRTNLGHHHVWAHWFTHKLSLLEIALMKTEERGGPPKFLGFLIDAWSANNFEAAGHFVHLPLFSKKAQDSLPSVLLNKGKKS